MPMPVRRIFELTATISFQRLAESDIDRTKGQSIVDYNRTWFPMIS